MLSRDSRDDDVVDDMSSKCDFDSVATGVVPVVEAIAIVATMLFLVPVDFVVAVGFVVVVSVVVDVVIVVAAVVIVVSGCWEVVGLVDVALGTVAKRNILVQLRVLNPTVKRTSFDLNITRTI